MQPEMICNFSLSAAPYLAASTIISFLLDFCFVISGLKSASIAGLFIKRSDFEISVGPGSDKVNLLTRESEEELLRHPAFSLKGPF